VLVVSLFALGLVVTPVLLLAPTRAVWTLALALLGTVAALNSWPGSSGAAFADADEPGTPPERSGAWSGSERVSPDAKLRDRRERSAA
jgi:hypothetical protein